MSFSRWKMMAGVLAVSLGGLATVAGQCPKPDTHRTARQASELPAKVEAPALPAVPSAGSGTPPQAPPAPVVPDIPSLPTPPVPAVPALPPTQTELPIEPPPSLPSLPVEPEPVKLPVVPTSSPAMPPVVPVLPASGTTPAHPNVEVPKPTRTPVTVPVPVTAPVVEGKTEIPPAPPMTAVQPVVKPAVVEAAVPQKVATVSKYRIVLRVGEGEPTFEVRTGDDLLLKVACEKVDIASPDKGSGPSKVTARGKVRFVGFGAEGTCQELSFWEGTGEVSLSGDVKIQVKDKLGRVESELATESMKYRIDPSVLNGSLKP